MSLEECAKTLNEWGSLRIPFLVLVDFEMKKPVALKLQEIQPAKLLFDVNGYTNALTTPSAGSPMDFIKFPPGFKDYKKKFERVTARLAYGDSYLTNLTIKTRIKTSLSLREIFFRSRAKYKVLVDGSFLVFSPETFIQIRDGKIFSYPMKGTIDAAVPEARHQLMMDPKEQAEHVTIVDLIRNDLSAVAENVSVTKFRYVEEIRTNQKNLLQISSEITGDLPPDHGHHLGDIIVKLLPAGSVSGAPKCKTAEIIRQAEAEPRGYYTGIVGLYDGNTFDSGVMIRYIENDNGTLYYRSGGGITAQSVLETEYQEAIDKVYVPVD